MSTAFIIGNGESRKIFPIERLKDKGTIYGCNAIYRDHSNLCDKIFAVNEPMFKELVEAKQLGKTSAEIVGPEDISDWNYILPNDDPDHVPEGLKLYRQWRGGDMKRGIYKTRDFSQNRGSGCSAVLHAAEQGYKNICILGFDIVGARQWEMPDGETSRLQNNIYANTPNYPNRYSMKAYMKYEWLYQLTQIFRRFPKTNFYFFNRTEYIDYNPYLRPYFRYAPGNIRVGIYADLMRYINGETIAWKIS
jgi:hypothetical protein